MTQPKLSKTHRWPPELYERIETAAGEIGIPVQAMIDRCVAAGLPIIQEEEHGAVKVGQTIYIDEGREAVSIERQGRKFGIWSVHRQAWIHQGTLTECREYVDKH